MVGAEALDGLGAFVLGEEARGGDGGVELPVDEGGRDDGDEADEEEDAGMGGKLNGYKGGELGGGLTFAMGRGEGI